MNERFNKFVIELSRQEYDGDIKQLLEIIR